MPATPPSPSALTITRHEMLAVSRLINRDFAPRFYLAHFEGAQQMPFTSQELRDIASHISRQYSHSSASRAAQLLLLPVAPGRLHLFWQLGPTPPEMPPDSTLSLQLTAENDNAPNSEGETLQLPLHQRQGHGELQLPAVIGDTRTAYQAAIGWLDDQHTFQPLLQSNSAEPATLPRPVTDHVATPAVEQTLSVLATGISSSRHHSGSEKTAVDE